MCEKYHFQFTANCKNRNPTKGIDALAQNIDQIKNCLKRLGKFEKVQFQPLF